MHVTNISDLNYETYQSKRYITNVPLLIKLNIYSGDYNNYANSHICQDSTESYSTTEHKFQDILLSVHQDIFTQGDTH